MLKLKIHEGDSLGPFILVDKSFIQSLNAEEASALRKHYCVFLCPVLLREILGNLAKVDFNPDEILSRVIALAAKADGIGSYALHDARQMMHTSLFNNSIKLQPGAPRYGGKPVVGPDGSNGIVFDQSEEELMLQRWRTGRFTEDDRLIAKLHNSELDDYDLPGSQTEMQQQFPTNKNLKSLEEIAVNYDRRGATDEIEWSKINAAGLFVPLTAEETAEVKAKWEGEGKPNFPLFADYASYCSRVMTIYFLGITAELISANKKHKTLIDILYFLYLPFVQTFCSGDKFHRDHFKYFSREDQKFVWGPDLKADLKQIVAYYNALSPEDRLKYDKELGSYPPFILNSVTRDMWERYCSPWKPGSGNQAIGKTAEEKKATMDYLNSLFKGSKE